MTTRYGPLYAKTCTMKSLVLGRSVKNPTPFGTLAIEKGVIPGGGNTSRVMKASLLASDFA